MERNQFWILVGLGVACGIFLEVIKTPSTPDVRLAGFSKFETLLNEGRQVYVPASEAQKEAAPRAKEQVAEPIAVVAQNEKPAAETEKKLTPEEEAAKKKAEEEKKKADEKKKKDEEAKKKKKKKKKKEEQVAETQEQQPTYDSGDDKKKGFSDDSGFGSGGGGVSYGFGAAPVSPDQMPVTVREWEAYLMKDADMNRLSKFIGAYQSGKVKAEVFYPVITAMLDDSRPKIRSLGVIALGAAPNLRSFGMLVEVKQNDASKEIKDQADVTLKSYARLENLRHLMIVISSGEPTTMAEAISLVRLSASTNLKRTSTAPQAQSTGSGTRRSTSTTAYFVQLLGPLMITAQKNGDANIRQLAGQTYSEIQSLMANQQTVTQTQPPVALQ